MELQARRQNRKESRPAMSEIAADQSRLKSCAIGRSKTQSQCCKPSRVPSTDDMSVLQGLQYIKDYQVLN